MQRGEGNVGEFPGSLLEYRLDLSGYRRNFPRCYKKYGGEEKTLKSSGVLDTACVYKAPGRVG
jgi:hypothetical protein